ncbi:MAG: putative quinol monooxygenase [Dehalococcoidia bacterium]
MIIIAGTVEIDPEKREAALAAGRDMEAAARKQPGCLDYVWTVDGLSPSTMYVFERWESEDALRSHFAGPNYNGMRAVLGSFGLRGASVLKYRIGLAEPVYDQTGTPRPDFFTEKQ